MYDIIIAYIEKYESDGLNQQQIKDKLHEGGYADHQIETAFSMRKHESEQATFNQKTSDSAAESTTHLDTKPQTVMSKIFTAPINRSTFIKIIIIYILLIPVSYILSYMAVNNAASLGRSELMNLQYCMYGISLVLFVIQFNIIIRRLHAVGRTWWWSILTLTPIAPIIYFYLVFAEDK